MHPHVTHKHCIAIDCRPITDLRAVINTRLCQKLCCEVIDREVRSDVEDVTCPVLPSNRRSQLSTLILVCHNGGPGTLHARIEVRQAAIVIWGASTVASVVNSSVRSNDRAESDLFADEDPLVFKFFEGWSGCLVGAQSRFLRHD
jgi:hypothetical protein